MHDKMGCRIYTRKKNCPVCTLTCHNSLMFSVTMDVDNSGPFAKEWETNIPPPVLDLAQPLYVGGVPDFNQLPDSVLGAGCVIDPSSAWNLSVSSRYQPTSFMHRLHYKFL